MRHSITCSTSRCRKGTGWLFTTGSVLIFLIGIQLVTGIVLSMYYVPTPSLAYDSVRYISTELTFGSVLRGLHFWGASFTIVAAAVHMLRVFFYGSYKAPREVTWITGVLLLLLILAFALSGYLLPWDQKAYWATTVTISIAETSPVIGDFLGRVLRGGSALGALTLGRWYTAHVFLLPAALVLFIVAHIALMRRHGISGPIKVQDGPPTPFYPWHAIKDTLVIAAVFASLLTLAITIPAHLDEIANPADSSYIPRPEWYFLSLFQLLKYFPGPLEPVATLVIPGLVVGFLFALPFLDRSGDRHPFRRARVPLTIAMSIIGLAVAGLTGLGLRDTPPKARPRRLGSASDRRPGPAHRKRQRVREMPRGRGAGAGAVGDVASRRTKSGCWRTWPIRWRLRRGCGARTIRRRRRSSPGCRRSRPSPTCGASGPVRRPHGSQRKIASRPSRSRSCASSATRSPARAARADRICLASAPGGTRPRSAT